MKLIVPVTLLCVLVATVSASAGCPRRKGWCAHEGGTFQMIDCDGDGIPDPTCSDIKGNFGVLKSSKKCADDWPHGKCQKSCHRRKGWCGKKGETFQLVDCDGDGIP